MSTFTELGISKNINKALKEMNIVTPSAIQEEVIPVLMKEDTDLVGQAPTGTGKTAAFGLPILHKVSAQKNVVQALILCPTRELGQQIKKQLFRFTKYSEQIYAEAVYGGAPIDKQIVALRRPTQIVVATPGRLIDLVERKAVDLSAVKIIVLDEADEMLSRGFKKELETILSFSKGTTNTWLFSATMPKGIKEIIDVYLSKNAKRIRAQKSVTVNTNITHEYMLCEEGAKQKELFRFLRKQKGKSGLVFCKTKASTKKVTKLLKEQDFKVDAMHGDLLQKERDKAMRALKSRRVDILVATDISARGIDIEGLAYVAHYELPDQTEYYTHRSGRTARAGKEGLSLSFITNRDLEKLMLMGKELGIKIKSTKK